MKIVFLQDDFPPQSFGGAGISTYELAIGMKKAGHEVFVITTCRKDSQTGETNHNGLKVFKIKSNYHDRWRAYVSLYNWLVVRQVKVLLSKIKPEVVHINNIHFYLSYYCFKLAKQYAKVVVFTARDTMSVCYGKLETKRYLDHFDCCTTWRDHLKQAGKRWNLFRNFFIRRYLKYADKIFAISQSLQEALQQNGINGVEVIYNGINLDEWHVDANAATYFRMKYHLFNKKVLLFNGRLSASKGGGKVIEALTQVTKEIPNVVLLVAGNIDWYAEVMKKQAKNLGLEKQLVFTGWIGREEIKIAYAISEVVLVPSIHLEAFGRVNIEAMAARKPVVGTCFGGTPEIVVNDVTGYVVDPRSVDKMAEKIFVLLKNSKKAEEFGQAGYDRVKTNFNLEDKVREYIVVYKTLLEKWTNLSKYNNL